MKQAYAIVDLQFGSTGKGLLAGYLAKRRKPDGVVCAFGPNAGHTYVDENGKKFMHVMVPMGALSPGIRTVFMGPGAIIHPELLMAEADHLHGLGYQFDLVIHEHAAVVQEHHRETESKYNVIGSTAKGVGAAMIEKLRRPGANVAKLALFNTPLAGNVVSVPEYNDMVDKIELMQIEGAQGFSLGINSGFYPYTTSRECTVWQLLSDCALPRRNVTGAKNLFVYGTTRTFPIRVNNRGHSSGPGYHDQEEVTWESLGLEPELTTVTKLPRRIFTWSKEQITQAVRANGVDCVFLNFCNYLRDVNGYTQRRDDIMQTGAKIMWTGWGAQDNDVREEK